MSTDQGKTGWPPGLLQDDDRGLSKWLASRPNARQIVRMVCAELGEAQGADAVVDEALLQRIADALPKADERETAWCSLQGHDLRAIYKALSRPAGRGALTNAEIQLLWSDACEDGPSAPGWNRHIRFAKAVEAAHGIRGGGGES